MAKVKGSQLPVVSEIDGTEKMFAIKGGQNVMVPTSLLNGDSNILLPNGVVVVGTMEAVALGTRFENWVWRNNQVVIEQAATQTINIPNTTEGYRVDMIIGNQAGVIQRIAGEVAGAFPVPTNNQTLITYLLVGVSGFETLDPAAQGFVTKSSYGINPVLGTNNVILKRGARTQYQIKSAVSIIGFQNFSDAPENDANYPGQLLYLYNDKATPCKLVHNSGTAPVPFRLPNNQDYYLGPYSGITVYALTVNGPYCIVDNPGKIRSYLYTPSWPNYTGTTAYGGTIGTLTFPPNFFPARGILRMTVMAKSWNTTNSNKLFWIDLGGSGLVTFFPYTQFGNTSNPYSVSNNFRTFRLQDGKMYTLLNNPANHDIVNNQTIPSGFTELPTYVTFDTAVSQSFVCKGNLTNATDALNVVHVFLEIFDETI